MADPIKGTPKPEDNIDESGWTSIDVEGAGKHPHKEEVYPDDGSRERWEVDMGGGPRDLEPDADERGADREDAIARGRKPVEGDGDGAPL